MDICFHDVMYIENTRHFSVFKLKFCSALNGTSVIGLPVLNSVYCLQIKLM